jgi:carboxyl-terminal processing protease
MVRPDLGYVLVTRFSLTTGDEFKTALESLQRHGMKALLLDLEATMAACSLKR